MNRILKKYILLMILALVCLAVPVYGQSGGRPETSQLKDPSTQLWINTYGNIRLTKRLFWVAQTHFRFVESENTLFAGEISQIYNRHAIGYIVSKKFNASLGGVLRINFNTGQQGELERRTVPEWRIWHQYLFANPLGRVMVYHRLRLEHRWTQGFQEDSEYIFRNRWRYMFKLKVPINKPELSTRTLFISPEAELIMQSGRPVVDSPMEDLRLHTQIGYIINPRLTVATGVMYSTGQELNDGAVFDQKWTMRFHVYFSPDIRKVMDKLPSIHFGE